MRYILKYLDRKAGSISFDPPLSIGEEFVFRATGNVRWKNQYGMWKVQRIIRLGGHDAIAVVDWQGLHDPISWEKEIQN